MIPLRADAGTGATMHIAGFPTRVKPTFLLLIAIVGWYPDITLFRLAIWIVVASAAVMWHELGHAFAARRLGASPRIELYGFGGATMWVPPTDPTRSQLIGVSFAGPFAGFVLGAITAIGVAIAGGTGTGDIRYFVLVALWTNVGWGLINLFPVLPLDGGHILAELLPGDRTTRTRRAAMVSIAVAAVGMVWLLTIEIVFGALVLGWIALSNMSLLRSGRAQDEREKAEDDARDALGRLGQRDPAAIPDMQRVLERLRPRSAPFRAVAIEAAAATGNAAGARALLDTSPLDEPLPPALYALVFAAESEGREGVEELVQILRREPAGAHARWLTIALRWADRIDELPTVLAALDRPVDEAVIGDAAAAAEAIGSHAVAREVRALLAG